MGEKALTITKAQLNDNKHHILIAPHLVSGILTNYDSNSVTFKLEDQKKLQQKVHDYFGKDVEFECYKHENQYPEYQAKQDAIVGNQKVKCALHPKGAKFDKLYEIDLDLTFEIHPEVDKDGKSLKAQFGDIQVTQIAAHDKKMEIQTTVSDRMEAMPMMDFGSLFGEGLFALPPFESANIKTQDFNQMTLQKFKEIMQTPNLIDIDQLEDNLMPAPFRLPIPQGFKFAPNSSVKIHENGVVDVIGDLQSE